MPSHQTSRALRPCLNNPPTASFRLSAALQATLRLTSDNSPPYFDASKAEILVEQGGESRHIRRRVSPSRAERVSTRGRRQCRRAGWGHLGGPTRPGRQAGLVQVSAPTPTLSAGRPLSYQRTNIPKPARRECRVAKVLAPLRPRCSSVIPTARRGSYPPTNLGTTHQGIVGNTHKRPSVIPTTAIGSYPPTPVGSTQVHNGVMKRLVQRLNLAKAPHNPT